MRVLGSLLLVSSLISCSDSNDSSALLGTDPEQEPVQEGQGDENEVNPEAGPAVTEGVIRVRRRHENDMDFSKYNPFYWEGRGTSFRVEDYTSRGENRIKFTLVTEWPQDYMPTRGPDFSAIYTGDPSADSEVMRSKFALNVRMNHIADHRVFEATIGPNEFNAFANELRKGSLLTFEFRFFNNESHPGWQRQKMANPHTLSAYYSEFIRIKIGEAGLLIDNPENSRAFAPKESYSGGATTIPTVRVEPWRALQQHALNLQEAHEQAFLDGRTWFHTDFISGQHIDDDSDDKPMFFFEEMRQARSNYAASAYNIRSCNVCHINNGIAMLPNQGQTIDRTIVKTLNKETGEAHEDFGSQLQTQGVDAEGTLKIREYSKTVVRLADGTQIELKKPRFVVEDAAFSTNNLALSPRKPQALIGLGLLEAVSDDTLRELAKTSKGELRDVNGRIGRFGWKADQPSVKDQIAAALNNDMGVRSSLRKDLECAPRCKAADKGQVPDEALDGMTAYLSLLGVPPRRNPNAEHIRRGASIFRQLNCQTCHVESLKTGDSKFAELSQQTIAPFTDLLLHDMGPGLADEAGPLASKWRTAPLWGLKNVRHSTASLTSEFPAGNINIIWREPQGRAERNAIQFLHDGRAHSIPEAILWHGGEAEESVKKYKELRREDREALEAFLWDL